MTVADRPDADSASAQPTVVIQEAFWARAQVRGEGWATLRFNAGKEGFSLEHKPLGDEESVMDIAWLDMGAYPDGWEWPDV